MGVPPESVIASPVASDSFVFRAYAFPDCFDRRKNKIQPKTFYRKPEEVGLSIGLSSQGLLSRYPGAAGMCTLTVGDPKTPGVGILGSPLDPLFIVQDEPDHAEIRGVPTRSEDQERALRIARYLVRIAEHVSLFQSS